MASYKLHYFAGRGRVEISRVMFALADVKYEDKRYSVSFGPTGPESETEYMELKASNKLPFGQVPMLEVTEGNIVVDIAQAHALARYIAREFGYFGKTNLEGALIDSVTEHVRDAVLNYQKAKSGADATEAQAKFFAEYLPSCFTHLDRFIESHSASSDMSTCVGSSISLADVYVWYLCTYFDDLVSAEKALSSCSHVVSVRDAVANNPRIKHWVDIRPKTQW